jgi:hypothetical protein
MCFNHGILLSPPELEAYRWIILENVVRGLGSLLDALDDAGIKVQDYNLSYRDLIRDVDENMFDLIDRALERLWDDPSVQNSSNPGIPCMDLW